MSPGRRWLMWSLPALLFLIAFFHRPAPGVLAKDLMQAFDATSDIVGLLSAMYFYAYAGLMIPGGVLLDAYGVRIVVSVGGLVMGLGTLLMSVAGAELTLFAGRFVVGLGASITFVGTLKIAAIWFPPERFGTLAALTATVGVLGSLVATVPLAGLVAALGWREALAAVGLTTLAAALACLWLGRDRPEGITLPAGPALGLRDVLAGVVEVLGNRHTWPPFLAFFCIYAAVGNLMLWVVPYLRDVYGLTTTQASVYATATPLALLFAAPLTGLASDRVIRRRKLPYTVLTLAQFALWVVFVSTLGQVERSDTRTRCSS